MPWIKKSLDKIEAVACPCGMSKRILTGEDGAQISIHRVRITRDAQKHYHKRLTEYYVVLSGTGEIELDDERVAVKPGDVIMIPPGTAHALRGEFEIINIVVPAFDANDEFGVE